MPQTCGPVRAPVVVAGVPGPKGQSDISLDIDPAEPVFLGHYPDHPIFPGVCVVDFVQRGALRTPPAPGGHPRLVGVDRVRFLDPVRPGDRLTARLSWQRAGESWRCAADVATGRGPAARLTLDFADETADLRRPAAPHPTGEPSGGTPSGVRLTSEGVKRRIPHRYPMLLVDRVLDIDPAGRLTALKAVTCNEPWYAAVTDDAGDRAYDYPAALVIESWCQAASLLLTEGSENPDQGLGDALLLFGGMSGVTLPRPVRPGDVMRHHVRLTRSFGDTFTYEGTTTVDGEPVLDVGRIVIAVRHPDATGRPAAAPEPLRTHA